MVEVIFYNLLMFSCWAYALFRGGAPERAGSTIQVIGSLLTVAAASSASHRFSSLETGIFLVDVGVLVAFVILALRANRFWPLWVAALQAVGTAGHVVKFADPTIIRWAYFVSLIIWSYPILLLMILGTWHHQQRLARYGADPSWSRFRW